MVLKRKYNLGYESLIQEIGDSFTWRRFCRIALDEPMPDPSTLIYARKRYGEEVVEKSTVYPAAGTLALPAPKAGSASEF